MLTEFLGGINNLNIDKTMKKLLHVGCGTFTKEKTIPYFFSHAWQEIRFDIDPNVKPDIVGSLTDMSALETESVDAIYSSQ